jgi:hypothetical protein
MLFAIAFPGGILLLKHHPNVKEQGALHLYNEKLLPNDCGHTYFGSFISLSSLSSTAWKGLNLYPLFPALACAASVSHSNASSSAA